MPARPGVRLVVEADGGSRGNPGPAAYGAVVRDAETGQVLAERAAHIGTGTNNVAEYRGLIAGLTAAREIDAHAVVEARLDSKLVVEQMTGRWKIKHPAMRPLALQAREILPAEQVTYVWVPRERNKHADRLANEALDAAARGHVWSEATSSAALRWSEAAARERAAAADVPLAGVEAGAVDEVEVETPVAAAEWDVGLGTPTTTLLARHGETAHTLRRLFSGAGGADPPLAPSGQAQAAALASALSGHDIAAVVSSPMRRARQTADVVAASLRLPVHEVGDLRECAFGQWEGRTLAEVRERWPDELQAWLGSTTVAPPGGESFDQLDRRVGRARDRLVARYAASTVVVVSHLTPIKALVRAALQAPTTSLLRMELSPASLTEIRWYPNGAASLRSFNGAAHLR